MELIHLIFILGFGFLLGLKHALDADHVVAVSTIITDLKNIKKASLVGAFWGLGHTTTLAVVGFFVLYFKLTMPSGMADFFEFIVGLLLVYLGINVFRAIKSEKMHLHKHKHGKVEHVHLHSHKFSAAHVHSHRSFLVGMVHGLAGSAGIMLLILTTIKSTWNGLFYIGIFSLGTILGMSIVTAVISLPFLASKNIMIINRIKILSGLMSVFLGIFIMYDIMYL